MIIRASILAHPNIPKPLHGVAPRVIEGKAWWDRIRTEVYKLYKFRCAACGIHQDKAAFHAYMEAHEFYDIDYGSGRVTLKEIVALCHSCHNFIHSGRLTVLTQHRKIPKEKAIAILEHGFRVLKRSGAKPNPVAAHLWLRLQGHSAEQARKIMADSGLAWIKPEPWEVVPWDQWYFSYKGKQYYSRFKSIDEWHTFYSKDQ